MTDFAERARRFRLRAEEVRSIADDMRLQKTRDMLEKTARDFENMAQRLEGEAGEEIETGHTRSSPSGEASAS